MERICGCTQGRKTDFFGFDWNFALTDSREIPGAETAWRKVQLPHDWSVDEPVDEQAPSRGSGGYARTGIGWYRKSFCLEGKAAPHVSLLFEGVYMNCDIFLNGRHLGGHVYGYTSFEMELTDALQEGMNELLVRVDNSHQPGSRWYSGSGITRNVWLIQTPSCRIPLWGIQVLTEIQDGKAKVTVETEIEGVQAGSALEAAVDILDAKGSICASACTSVRSSGAQTVRQTLEMDAFDRWDIENPALYTASVVLRRYGQTLDMVSQRFGIREIAFDAENGFLLNGRKVILRGVCLHHDGGCVGAAVPWEIWKRRLEKLKGMGCNALRMSHNPPDPALLNLADEMGFAVMDEAFDEWRTMKLKEFGANTHASRGYSEWYDGCWRDDMVSMLRRDRNHPSIVMWSIGNEIYEQVSEDGWQVARELAGICHTMDSTRPVTAACDQEKAEPRETTERFLEELDIVGVNYPDRWRERTESFLLEEKREHPHWKYLGTEDVAVNGPRGDVRLKTQESVWGRTPYYANMLKAEKLWKFVRTNPWMIGDFMWTGIDYLGETFWPNKGSSAGVLDTCGFPKNGYWFYRSIWTRDEPVLYLWPHLNLELEEGTIYPLIAYTNCFSVELFVDGKSWGVKAYEFPAQGMTERWAHFDRPFAPVTTNDLHLSWDVPYTQGEIVAIGRDENGKEIVRQVLKRAGKPVCLEVKADRNTIPADGRSIVQLEMALRDAQGQIVPDADVPVHVSVDGGKLLGMDSGRMDDLTPWHADTRSTFRGLCFAVIQAERTGEEIRVRIEAENLPAVSCTIRCV